MSGSATVGGISIPIFAVDNATAVITRVNKSIAGMTQGTTRFGQATRAATDVNMVNRLSLGFKGLGREVFNVFKSVERTVPLLGVLTSGGIVAGVTALERHWADLGQTISNTAVRLGITTASLSSWQGAARLAGGSAADMTAGLGSLDEKLRSATFRGDGQAQLAFKALGVNFGEIGIQARSADDAMGDVADGLKRIYDTQGRGAAFRVAQLLGLESLFPQLVKGKAALEAWKADVARLGGTPTPDMIERSEKLKESFGRVGIAIGGLANKIADRLSPAMTRLLNHMADLIAANSTWIAQDIGGFIGKVGEKIKSIDWTDVNRILTPPAAKNPLTIPDKPPDQYTDEDYVETDRRTLWTFIDWLKHHIPGAGGTEPPPSIYRDYDRSTGPISDWLRHHLEPTSVPTSEQSFFPRWHWPHLESAQAPITMPQAPSAAAGVMGRIHDFFAGKGVPEENIAGILANVSAESRFNPKAWGDNHSSYGLFQYHGDRLKAMQLKYGEEPSLDEQLQFASNDPQMRTTLDAMKGKGSPASGAIFSRGFEGPSGGATEDWRRGAAAPQFVQVDVNLHGDTKGVTAVANGSGAVKPRVSVAMPHGGGF